MMRSAAERGEASFREGVDVVADVEEGVFTGDEDEDAVLEEAFEVFDFEAIDCEYSGYATCKEVECFVERFNQLLF
jgi:hypothetical protein